MDIQTISTVAGIISMGITVLGVVIGGVYIGKSNISKIENDAQMNAISAMQSEINTLRGRTDDLKNENTRLEYVVDTICAALKTRGMIITIQGEMVNIQDEKGSVTTRILHAKNNNN